MCSDGNWSHRCNPHEVKSWPEVFVSGNILPCPPWHLCIRRQLGEPHEVLGALGMLAMISSSQGLCQVQVVIHRNGSCECGLCLVSDCTGGQGAGAAEDGGGRARGREGRTCAQYPVAVKSCSVNPVRALPLPQIRACC